MTALTEFLLARIAEDEAVAQAAMTAPRPRGGWGGDDLPTGGEWETREQAGVRLNSGMLYVPSIENAADSALWDDEGGCDYMAPSLPVGQHMARHDPVRVLAECEAKRRIVEREVNSQTNITYRREFVLRDLASVYADHPDYDDEWRP